MTRYNFVRRNTTKYLRLGKKRKKTQKWQKPRGRDNKMRLKIKGRPKVVSIGYTRPNSERWKVDGKTPVFVKNINDLKKVKHDNIAILGRVGMKKKMEIAKKAKEMKINININVNKILKKHERKHEKKEGNKTALKEDKK